MTRSPILAAIAVPLLIAGCGPPAVEIAADNAASRNAATEFEDVSSDGLAAPEGMPLDSESNGAGNAD